MKRTALPILDAAVIQDNELYISALEYAIKIPFKQAYNGTILIADLIYLIKEYPELKLAQVKDGFRIDSENESIQFKEVFNMGDYPKCDDDKNIDIGTISKDTIKLLAAAKLFAGNDEMREVMCNIFFDKKIVATDAHTLYVEDNPDKVTKPILIPKIVVSLLEIIKEDFNIEIGELHDWRVRLTSESGIKIYFKMNEDRFPNYEAVIPDTATTTAKINSEMLTIAIKRAKRFSNPVLKQSRFDFADKTLIIKAVNDQESEYKCRMPLSDMIGAHLEIGFNCALMLKILMQCKGELEIKMTAPNRAALINDKYLLMPVMLQD